MNFPTTRRAIDREGPVVYHLRFASADEIRRAEAVLDEIDFQPLHHGGDISRYQQSIDNDACDLVQRIREVLDTVRAAIEPSGRLSVETYAFQYLPDQGVPEHRDKRRHVASLMVYIGDYKGGGFTYYKDDEEVKLELNSGDALLLLNETSSGKWRNPLHRVEEVQSGRRSVIVGSLVRE